MNVALLTKKFVGANQKILHQDKFYHEIKLFGTINTKIDVESPVYISISDGKAMQRNDIANFANDFSKSTELAKLKMKNGKATTTE